MSCSPFLILVSFQTFWQNLATVFISDPHVIFDLCNEPYGIPATDAASLMQAGINGVRASGATQLILVEGTSWTGAWCKPLFIECFCTLLIVSQHG